VVYHLIKFIFHIQYYLYLQHMNMTFCRNIMSTNHISTKALERLDLVSITAECELKN